MDTKPIDRLSFFLEQVKIYDYDLYLYLCFIPERLIKSICLLFCFEIEMQKILLSSNEDMIKRIKFKWWQDAFENKNHYNNPLLEEIFRQENLNNFNYIEIIKLYEATLSKENFKKIIWPKQNIFTYSNSLLLEKKSFNKKNDNSHLNFLYKKYFIIKNHKYVDYIYLSQFTDLKEQTNYQLVGIVKILNTVLSWQKTNVDQYHEFRKPNFLKLVKLFFIFKF